MTCFALGGGGGGLVFTSQLLTLGDNFYLEIFICHCL